MFTKITKEEFTACMRIAELGSHCVYVGGMIILVDDFITPNSTGIDPQPYYTIIGRVPITEISSYTLEDDARLSAWIEKSNNIKLSIPQSYYFLSFEIPNI